MSLRVLIVEDQSDRQEILKSLFKDHAWVLAHTAARAVRLVNAYRYDLIALDYDLAGEEKGELVAEAIAASPNAAVPVLVHSQNAPGAARIRKHLPNAVAAPIASITRDNASFKRLREAFARGAVYALTTLTQ